MEKSPKPEQKEEVKGSEQRKCSKCGSTLSIYNKTNQCFRHHESADNMLPPQDLYERMPLPGNPERGRWIRPTKKSDKK